MTTTPVTSSTGATKSTTQNPSLNLKPLDFINMMVTQLQNQDPLSPTSSQDLLAQMSEIGQLQSSDTLQSDLQTMTQQNSIGSASGLMGKNVAGLDANNNTVSGKVTSIQVAQNTVTLGLDTGGALPLANVTAITPAAAATATTSTAAATPAPTGITS